MSEGERIIHIMPAPPGLVAMQAWRWRAREGTAPDAAPVLRLPVVGLALIGSENRDGEGPSTWVDALVLDDGMLTRAERVPFFLGLAEAEESLDSWRAEACRVLDNWDRERAEARARAERPSTS